MAKNLVIVESPAKAKTIEKILGKDFKVTSSFGHVRDLEKANMGIDIKNGFEPKYKVQDDKKKVVKELKSLMKDTEQVWLATDEDREGEAISWHLCEVLGLDPVKTKRIVFHEITKNAIQKAVEMGVSRIQPVTTTRSVIKLSSERAAKRLQHWQQITIAACEQCGRNHVPDVLPPLPFPHWLGEIKTREVSTHTNLLLLPTAEKKLSELVPKSNNSSYTLLIGPEGGFTPEEERAALLTHFEPILVGKRILRTETAALATIAAMQTLWGDY